MTWMTLRFHFDHGPSGPFILPISPRNPIKIFLFTPYILWHNTFINTANSKGNQMKTTYSHKSENIKIEVRQIGFSKVAWAHFVDDKYKGSKVLPKSNTAIVQNFGYTATDFQ
jgi:hypothetical protein